MKRVFGSNAGCSFLLQDTKKSLTIHFRCERLIFLPQSDVPQRSGTKLLEVKATPKQRNAAADHAASKLVGKPYNVLVPFEKDKNGGAFTCSQLVWAAYMHQSIDLDSGKGAGVFPDDILNSELTTTYKILNKK